MNIHQALHDAMLEACAAVQIVPPRHTRPGEWVKTPVVGKKASNKSGRVLVFDDERGGICWNWSTGQEQRFSIGGLAGANEIRAPREDPEKIRQRQVEQAEISRICGLIVRACHIGEHPYLAAKGFPDETGLVIEDPRAVIPDHDLGWRIKCALPESGDLLVVPGRIGKTVTTIQFITPVGEKKNILGGLMGGAAHRIASGSETWVCEGIATALSVRAALRLLGRSATVLSAFAAQNVCVVAKGLRGAIVAADNDKPIPALGGLGTGEYWARESKRAWCQPPSRGDFNDLHQEFGLRAVAMLLRGVPPP